MDEFSLIHQFFKSIPLKQDNVLVGIGDDAACLQIPPKMNVLVSTDSLVSGVHFLPEWDAYDIATRAVQVNVSDMAAMGAEPHWLILALTLPQINPSWLDSFSQGLKASLNQFNMDLIGGDTTQGPLSMTLTIMGLAPTGKAILRGGAKPGDVILVSGELGGAALALKLLNEKILTADRAQLMEKLLHPQARVDLIPFLRAHASAAIDISDGLSGDLNHLCKASGVGACISRDAIPIHPLLDTYCKHQALDLALTGGDDYELCFTVPSMRLAALMDDLKHASVLCYPIGFIEKNPGLRIQMEDGSLEELKPCGYTHFYKDENKP